MILAGVGFGVGMPILNLAVQNEFADEQLGVATASSQLFRGLGSTIGTAGLTAILVAGIGVSLGNINDDAYIKSLQRKFPGRPDDRRRRRKASIRHCKLIINAKL